MHNNNNFFNISLFFYSILFKFYYQFINENSSIIAIFQGTHGR